MATVALLLCSAGKAQARLAPEQTSFSAEDSGMQHPVKIPAPVMALLEQDRRVRNVADYEDIPVSRIPASWFSASTIHLGSGGESDLIVAGEGPLMGANVETFWVVVRARTGYRIALMVPAHDLSVQQRRTRGYRNIRASAETCCTIMIAEFRFDGTAYQRAWSKTENIR